MATSAVNVDAIPTPLVDIMPSVEIDASPAVNTDAIPLTINEDTNQLVDKLELILNKLTIADYRSIFFMFIDVKLEKENFLIWVNKEKYDLKQIFFNIYKEFPCKDSLLIEIFGTMQKYDLLKYLGTCCHIFKKDKETFTQLSSLWKFLYAVCEQLADNEVNFLKGKLFPEEPNLNVCCAEELICLAFLKGKLEENNWERRLADIFKILHPDISKFITSYKASNLSYYPIRRPMKTTPCGIAVIMNHVNFEGKFRPRPESDKDANALKKLWESFGFKTEIHTDLTFKEVNQVFSKLSRENHSNYDAFVACYLSHGDEGIVFTKDGKQIMLLDLIDKMANECVTLVGKPKLFFVQACQGHKIQTGVGGPTLSPQISSQHMVPNNKVPISRHSLRADVLLFMASIEGYACFRDGNGSWFIEALVSEMDKYDEELTLANVVKKVKCKIIGKEGIPSNTNAKCKQTPVEYSTLVYELKLKKAL